MEDGITQNAEAGGLQAEEPPAAPSEAMPFSLSPDLASHVRSAHDLSPAQYRREVLGRALAEWPTPVPAQVMRTRLFAYKQAFKDEFFKESHCACCARRKRLCKLTEVVFPPKGCAEPPAWLGWTAEEWQLFGVQWYDDVQKVLDIHAYLTTYFTADTKVESAKKELADAQTKLAAPSEDEDPDLLKQSVDAAEIWLQRVLLWRSNLLADLTADSVPSPSCDGHRWLLFLPDHVIHSGLLFHERRVNKYYVEQLACWL